jgi:predicted metalloprotease with PDZ domain
MRVYWSGAAMMLMADTQLRETSGGSQSLDTALQSLSACCMKNGRTWRAREMFTQLDKLTGTTIFTELYKKHVHEEGFPDMRSTWENLGINTWRDRVSLSEDAPLAGVRSAIMKG